MRDLGPGGEGVCGATGVVSCVAGTVRNCEYGDLGFRGAYMTRSGYCVDLAEIFGKMDLHGTEEKNYLRYSFLLWQICCPCYMPCLV